MEPAHAQAAARLALAAGAPGVRLLAAEDGRILADEAAGWAQEWASDVAPLPVVERSRVDRGTRFDLASITKLFTASTVMRLVEQGRVDLDEPIGRHLFCAAGDVTLRHLLTHVAGLPPVANLEYVPGSAADRRRALLAIAPECEPGTSHVYSCVGFLLTGLLIEEITRASLADAVRATVIEPLGLTDTGYLPTDPSVCAATEYDRLHGRGMVRGVVHDESSWSLGGVAGNAGIFSTAQDLLVFGETIRGLGQAPSGARILAEDTVREMLRPQLPASAGAAFGQGLGFRIGDQDNMGDPDCVGHTGFTGTLLAIDPSAGRCAVVLTNAVHPLRGLVDKPRMFRSVMQAVRSDGTLPPDGAARPGDGQSDGETGLREDPAGRACATPAHSTS